MAYPEMRRKERILSEKEAEQIISCSPFGVLSLCDNDYPYGVPVNAVLYKDKIYFHCANTGYKLDIIKKNPNGHFVFVLNHEVLAEKATTSYKCAMVSGKMRIVDSEKERNVAFAAIIERYMKQYPETGAKTVEDSGKATTIVAMDIEKITAKGN